ncbi:MAG: hypothetical protein M3Y56_14260, partial [Armatimonadota bacterium]|nr:hypothetical protein [Armatimonadota bacterium]
MKIGVRWWLFAFIPACSVAACFSASAVTPPSAAGPSTAANVTAPAAPSAPAPSPITWDGNRQGNFVMALAQDQQGQIWVGCEDTGVWRYNPASAEKERWTQFTTKDGLGDDNGYALAVDRLNRVWVGHLNHGVSVFNGKSWRNYTVMDGPLGSRVFAIATCPTDGDVWMATDAGLSRYSLKKDTWSYYTRAEGLPSDQANALAFDKAGNIFVGTQCDGIAMAYAAADYKTWRVEKGPEQMPITPGGKGLPTNLINCLLVSPSSGTVYAGTTTGLARSEDSGKTWRYLRGADWKDKVLGLYKGPAPMVADTRGHNLLEDYVTALAEDEAGRLWVGYRQKGLEAVDPRNGTRVFQSGDDYVTSIQPMSGVPMLVGHYGTGVGGINVPPKDTKQFLKETENKHIQSSLALAAISQFPAVAQPPNLSELKAMLQGVQELSSNPSSFALDKPTVIALNDDWGTQGTWVDHYGNFAAVLCAMDGGGNDQVRGYRGAWADRRGWIGRNGSDNDYLRYYVTWPHTEDPRSLQDFWRGGRKQAEWDDHGETKPMTLAGSHIYGTLRLPKGHYILSCYFFNKDAHSDDNRIRDYLVEVRSTPMTDERFEPLGAPVGYPGREAEALFEQSRNGDHARVRNFWGGVWKRFYVDLTASGFNFVTVRVNRNHSFNTILSGLFVDPVGQLPGPAGPILQPAATRRALYARPVIKSGSAADNSIQLIDQLLVLRDTNPAWYSANSRRYLVPILRRLLDKQGDG